MTCRKEKVHGCVVTVGVFSPLLVLTRIRIHIRVRALFLSLTAATLDSGEVFQRSYALDEKIISKTPLPASLQTLLDSCEEPPALNTLTRFRSDGVKALTLYTDPLFFRRLWIEMMMQDAKAQLEKRKKKKVELYPLFGLLICLLLCLSWC